MTYSAFVIFPFLAVAYAANDWSKPCLSGECSYDLPAASNGTSASGSMKIWGSSTAISDITTAAGWTILGCSPTALTQDIRLVCTGKDSSMCQHLYQGHGAVDTIVRLPENCGKSPFARVAKAWVPADQSIPASIAARIVRRDGSKPQVKAITLDTNYAAADNSKTGAVNLAIKGANVPGVNAILANDTTASQRRSRHNSRAPSNFVTDAANTISNAVSSANTININKQKALPAADFSKKVSLFDKSLSCPGISASVSVDIDATAHAVVTLGVAASGTIIPPKITDFAIIAGLTADLNGDIELTADLSGTIDSGSIKLFETGIPGFNLPGILSIGPTFEVNANAKATLDLNVDLTVGINYHVDNAQLFFPPRARPPGAPSRWAIRLSADTKAAATGSVEAHVIPSINLGISALGVVDATVFLDLDASATMTLKVEGSAGASATVQQANSKRQDDGFADDTSDSADNSTDDSADADSGFGDSSDDEDTSDDFDPSADDQDTSADDGSDDTAVPADDGTDASDDGDVDSDSTADDGVDATDDGTDDTSLDSADSTDAGTDESTADDSSDADPDATATDSTADVTSTDIPDADPTDGSDPDDATPTDSGDPTATDGTDVDPTDSTTSDDPNPTDSAADATPTDTDTDPTDSSDSDLSTSTTDGLTDPTDSSDSDLATSTTDSLTDPTDSSDSDLATSTDFTATAIATDSASITATDSSDLTTPTDSSFDDSSATTDSSSNSATTTSDPLSASATPTDSASSSDSDDSFSTTASATDSDSGTSSTATATSTSSAPLFSATTAADASFGGSFVISAGLDVNAGATGSFFGLFDKSTKVSLFKKDFELLSIVLLDAHLVLVAVHALIGLPCNAGLFHV
ncbi:hypothetical protein B0H10DRAFT_2226802 [Mycena sp. CBHHK59/15]|nr:hypothetical protein B0H10DRAFT_2226802 [Mycena sp. CBHHK59/15]